ncbi:hypothetical protein Q9233_003646 [Columba guinea]|nr:hypothetical protein Q9233_003646 [Columba guinea]
MPRSCNRICTLGVCRSTLITIHTSPYPAEMTDKVMNGRVPLPEKALSEGYARLRYRDTSMLIWQQQQQKLESAPPNTYLSRSRSMWYSQYGNEAILVRDKNKLDVSRDTGQSKFCAIM